MHNSLYLKYNVQNLSKIIQIDVEEIIRVSVWKIWDDKVFRVSNFNFDSHLDIFARNMTFARLFSTTGVK